MEVEFYYDTFMYAQMDELTLRLTIVDDDTLMYHLRFKSADERSAYQKMLHGFAFEFDAMQRELAPQLVKELVLHNPFDFDYELTAPFN